MVCGGGIRRSLIKGCFGELVIEIRNLIFDLYVGVAIIMPKMPYQNSVVHYK
jgi:hypothetical protein